MKPIFRLLFASMAPLVFAGCMNQVDNGIAARPGQPVQTGIDDRPILKVDTGIDDRPGEQVNTGIDSRMMDPNTGINPDARNRKRNP